ncbi:hypothetical protein [Flavonifractor plautii]|uniref:Uncharacterized protein n=1 Tax=Candidatus Flavonifractor intestinigallinarum TaxID=2838586 RepID=A0A9D2MJ93_9FIRM|nr:hypothetical protein [Flavonifractor plautii]MBM6664884.1 hypothetical protein [Flavonifractor plautii]HJB79440.1 hypothetical protein [Candidatus Flavonifractor intestinigallinarum]
MAKKEKSYNILRKRMATFWHRQRFLAPFPEWIVVGLSQEGENENEFLWQNRRFMG